MGKRQTIHVLAVTLMALCLIIAGTASVFAQGNGNGNGNGNGGSNAGGNSPAITGAAANFGTNQITIIGTNLNTGGTPTVNLGTYPALGVVSSSASSIVANLPLGVAAG